MRAKTIRYPFLWKGAYVLSRLPDSLAHCLQVQRQKANMKTGFSLQWPLLAQFSQDELWSSHPLCITADKEIIAMLFMPMHWLFKTKVHGNTLTRKCRRVKVSGNRFEQFYFGGSPQLLLFINSILVLYKCPIIDEQAVVIVMALKITITTVQSVQNTLNLILTIYRSK